MENFESTLLSGISFLSRASSNGSSYSCPMLCKEVVKVILEIHKHLVSFLTLELFKRRYVAVDLICVSCCMLQICVTIFSVDDCTL